MIQGPYTVRGNHVQVAPFLYNVAYLTRYLVEDEFAGLENGVTHLSITEQNAVWNGGDYQLIRPQDGLKENGARL